MIRRYGPINTTNVTIPSKYVGSWPGMSVRMIRHKGRCPQDVSRSSSQGRWPDPAFVQVLIPFTRLIEWVPLFPIPPSLLLVAPHIHLIKLLHGEMVILHGAPSSPCMGMEAAQQYLSHSCAREMPSTPQSALADDTGAVRRAGELR